MNQRDMTELRARIRAMWEQELDTVDMAWALQVPEYVIEAQLHIALDRRRAVVGSLKDVS